MSLSNYENSSSTQVEELTFGAERVPLEQKEGGQNVWIQMLSEGECGVDALIFL